MTAEFLREGQQLFPEGMVPAEVLVVIVLEPFEDRPGNVWDVRRVADADPQGGRDTPAVGNRKQTVPILDGGISGSAAIGLGQDRSKGRNQCWIKDRRGHRCGCLAGLQISRRVPSAVPRWLPWPEERRRQLSLKAVR